MNTKNQVRFGTLSTKLQTGLTVVIGKYLSEYRQNKERQNFQFYLYSEPLVNLVLYDATLQGGVFNRSSDYVLKGKDISRIVLQNNFGSVLKYKSIYLEYYQSIISREFKTGKLHRWGGIRIGFIF